MTKYIEHMPGMYVRLEYYQERLSYLDSRIELRHYAFFSTSGYDPHAFVLWAALNRRVEQQRSDYI